MATTYIDDYNRRVQVRARTEANLYAACALNKTGAWTKLPTMSWGPSRAAAELSLKVYAAVMDWEEVKE